MTVEDILLKLKVKFPDVEFVLENELPVESFIVVPSMGLNKICEFLRDDEELFFDSLMNLSGVDDNNAKKVKDKEGNEKIEGRTLSVYYHLHSMKHDHKVSIKVSPQIEKPEVESVESIHRN